MPTKTDSTFTAHKCTIIKAKINEPFYIIPFGDIHRESENFAHEEWEAFRARCKERLKRKENIYFLGMGDYVDGCSTSERAALMRADLHDTTRGTLRDVYRGVVKSLANELAFMQSRIIGMLGGNHYYEMEDGQSTDQMLATSLGSPYFGVCAAVSCVVTLQNQNDTDRQTTRCIDIFAHHGKSGGSTPGGQLNAVENMLKVADADLYLMGHTHGKAAMPSFPRMKLVHGKNGVQIRARTPYLGRTGSFLKTYESGKRAYGVDALYPACALGTIEFEYIPRRIRKDGLDLMEFEVAGKA